MYGSGLEWKREDTEMEDDRNGTTLHQMETASLICGVLSIVFYFLSLGFVSMILGIVAIVLGNRCRTQGGSVAGFVCGIVGTCPVFDSLRKEKSIHLFVEATDAFVRWEIESVAYFSFFMSAITL